MIANAPEWLTLALQILAPSGVVTVAVKSALNGTRNRVKEIAEDTKEIRKNVEKLQEARYGDSARITLLEEHVSDLRGVNR